MSRVGRLDKLWPLLSARERSILVLKSAKTGEKEDYRIQTTIHDHQIPEFNRYIRLMNRVNVELNLTVGILRLMVEKMGLKLAWLATLRNWSLQTTRLWGCLGNIEEPSAFLLDAIRDSPSAAWTYSYGSEGAEEPAQGSLGFGDQLARALIETISQQLKAHWAELRAIEKVLDEAAMEFDGEDPAHPKLRQEINELKETVGRLRCEAVGCFGGVQLAEPTDGELEMMRKFVLGDKSL